MNKSIFLFAVAGLLLASPVLAQEEAAVQPEDTLTSASKTLSPDDASALPGMAPAEPRPAAAAAEAPGPASETPADGEWAFLNVRTTDQDEDVLALLLPQVEDWLVRNPEHPSAGAAQLAKAQLQYKLGDYKSALMALLKHFYAYPQDASSEAAAKLFQEILDKKMDKKLRPGLLEMSAAVEPGETGARLYSMLQKLPGAAGAALYGPIMAEHRDFLNRFPDRPGNDVVRMSAADMYLNMKDYLPARLAYEKVIEMHPASPLMPRAKLFRAVVLADFLKEYDAAIKAFLDITVTLPGTDQAWAAYARLPVLAEKRDQYPLAVETYEKIITLYPDREEAYASFKAEARVLREELKNPAGAIGVLGRLADKYKGERAIEGLFLAAEIARKDLKDLAAEVPLYDRIVAEYPADPQAPRALFAAGEAYEKAKSYEKAREYYSTVAGKYSEDPLAKKAQKRIDGLLAK